MKVITIAILFIALIASACGSTTQTPQATTILHATATFPPPIVLPSDTLVPTYTPSSTNTHVPTDTPIPTLPSTPATATPIPQPLLLRRKCGRDYIVQADKPVQIFYSGWGVKGKELADQ